MWAGKAAAAGLSTPVPTLTFQTTGGSLSSGVSACTISVSAVDASGNQTQQSTHYTFLFPGAVTTPAAAPTSAGSVDSVGTWVNGTTYYFVYTAMGLNGESLPSPERSVVGSGKYINLTWTLQTGAYGYRVYYGTTSGGPYNSYFYIPGIVKSAWFRGPNGAAGSPPASNTSTTTTTGSVLISWPAVTGASSYRVYREKASPFALHWRSVAGTSYTLTDATSLSGWTEYVANPAGSDKTGAPFQVTTAGLLSTSDAQISGTFSSSQVGSRVTIGPARLYTSDVLVDNNSIGVSQDLIALWTGTQNESPATIKVGTSGAPGDPATVYSLVLTSPGAPGSGADAYVKISGSTRSPGTDSSIYMLARSIDVGNNATVQQVTIGTTPGFGGRVDVISPLYLGDATNKTPIYVHGDIRGSYADDAILGWDGSTVFPKFGLVKQSGQQGKIGYANTTFAITQYVGQTSLNPVTNTQTDRLTIDTSGNIGLLGAVSASSTLAVTGAITASSTLTATGVVTASDYKITGPKRISGKALVRNALSTNSASVGTTDTVIGGFTTAAVPLKSGSTYLITLHFPAIFGSASGNLAVIHIRYSSGSLTTTSTLICTRRHKVDGTTNSNSSGLNIDYSLTHGGADGNYTFGVTIHAATSPGGTVTIGADSTNDEIGNALLTVTDTGEL
jgi:hypothetical protein